MPDSSPIPTPSGRTCTIRAARSPGRNMAGSRTYHHLRGCAIHRCGHRHLVLRFGHGHAGASVQRRRGRSVALDHHHGPARAHPRASPDAAVLRPEGGREVPQPHRGAVPQPHPGFHRGRTCRPRRAVRPSIPPRIIATILGIDPETTPDEFTGWVQGVLEFGLRDADVREHYSRIIRQFFLDEIATRVDDPVTTSSFLLQADIDGEPVSMHVVRGNISLMLITGIDTTWSSIGSAWRLAAHPAGPAASRRGRAFRSPSRSSSGPTRRSRWLGSPRATRCSAIAWSRRESGSC